MPSMTTYRQGQVVLVPFPWTDLSGAKLRPAVVVSGSWYNTSRRDCILVALSSQIPKKLDRDMVRIDGPDLKSAGLPLPSVVKAGKVFTVDQARIVKPLGQLTKTSLDQVLTGMKAAISDK